MWADTGTNCFLSLSIPGSKQARCDVKRPEAGRWGGGILSSESGQQSTL